MTYEYQCVGCQYKWEAEQKITDPPLKQCPECGEEKARRLISRSTFILQGAGWFKSGGY
jgi:putative FmdB family regulatory protein